MESMSGMSIPPSLKFELFRMIGDAAISTNVLRLIPLNLQSASGGGLISVRLPLATCSLPSFSMSFNNTIQTVPSYSSADGTLMSSTVIANNTSFPQGLEGLIQRLEIVVAGVSLMTLPNYNMLFQVLKDATDTLDNRMSRHIVEGEDDVSGIPLLTNGSGGSAVAVKNITPITVTQWEILTNSTTTLTIACSSPVLPELFATGVTLYALNAPPSTFFGATGGAALSGLPTVTLYQAGPVPIDGFTAGTGYNFILTYAMGSSTWTLSGVSVTTVYNNPFTFFASPTSSDVISGFTPPNSQYNTIREFLGFFKSQPKCLQLAALGEVEVRIYLEQAQNCLTSYAPQQTLAQGSASSTPCKQTGAGQYQLQNVEFQIRSLSWDNSFLDSMMQTTLAEGRTLEIPYPNYYSVVQGGQSSGQTTTRFSVNTQNLRRVWAVNRPQYNAVTGFTSFNAQQLLVPSGVGVNAYNRLGNTYKGSFFCTSASNPSYWSQFATGGNLTATNATNTSNKWNYLINNQLIPNLQVAPQRTWAFTKELLGMEDSCEGTYHQSPLHYMSFGYSMAITLEYIEKYAPENIRELFGLDTRSASSVFYLNQTNNLSGDTTIVFSEFTSVLRVAANNQVQVVV